MTNPTYDAIQKRLAALQAEKEMAQKKLASIQEEEKKWKNAAEVVSILQTEAPAQQEQPQPQPQKAPTSIKDRVVLFFETKQTEVAVKDVVEALAKESEVFYPSVASDISRLKKEGILEQTGRGIYRLAQKGDGQAGT